MQIIKNHEIIEDSWQLLGMDEPLVEGDIIVPFERWQAERAQLLAHSGLIGVNIDGGQLLSELVNDLSHFSIVALNFKVFGDGRAYSYAHLLRERHHYTGELRAVGDVLHDQLGYMMRCGIDSFMMQEGQNLEESLTAFNEFSAHYQTAADRAEPIYRQRHA